jgi:hypothetical protein
MTDSKRDVVDMKPAISTAPAWFETFTDFQGFIESKNRDKLWDKLPDKLFQKIYKNADSDLEGIRDFLVISNRFDLLKISYPPLLKQQKMYRDFVLHTLIAHALLDIGRVYLHKNDSNPDVEDLVSAEQYFRTALLCDEFCIPAWQELAKCYRDLTFGKEKILDLQKRFHAVIRRYHYDRLNSKQREYFAGPEATEKIGKDIEKLAERRLHIEQTKNTI